MYLRRHKEVRTVRLRTREPQLLECQDRALLLVSPLPWPILPAQFLTGLALGWLRSRHDSIAPTIAVHAVADVLAGFLV